MIGKAIREAPASDVAAFLDAVRQAPPRAGPGRGRLIFAMDATASREPTWDRAAEVQGQMFVEADRLGGLDVQLVFWRGFHECRASRWVASPKALVELMTKVTCRAGQTQLARVLRHAKAEAGKARVHALVVIGDAFEEGLDELGHLAGELGLLGTRAFLFQEGHDPTAERAFREVARLTGGAWCRFDASSPQQLRDLLAAVAAFAAGGRPALEDAARRRAAPRLLLGQMR
jgi:hypothetical protein